jgi:hypothetical protein
LRRQTSLLPAADENDLIKQLVRKEEATRESRAGIDPGTNWKVVPRVVPTTITSTMRSPTAKLAAGAMRGESSGPTSLPMRTPKTREEVNHPSGA